MRCTQAGPGATAVSCCKVWGQSVSWLKGLLLVCALGVACPAVAMPDAVTALRAKYVMLKKPLRQNQFKRPLVLDSTETPDHLEGDIYAIADYPFAKVNAGLNNPDHWCEILLLHINTKYCHAVKEPSGTALRVYVGKKIPEKLDEAARIDFSYSVAAATPEYIEITLDAQDGPMGTSNYQIVLEAVALPNAKTFLHLSYAYAINFSGRLAMQSYLATIGSDKVGFTVIGKQADGQPDYIGGVRGVVERNTMRYFLAIDAYLGAASAPPAAQFEKRLQGWFTAVENYSRQLHEMDRNTYLEMKRAEYVRQQTVY